MTSFFIAQFRNHKETDSTVMGILAKLSPAELNADRGGYYKSLGATMAHVLGGTVYFAGLLKDALPAQAARLDAIISIKEFEGDLDEADAARLASETARADSLLLEVIESLSSADLDSRLKLDWYPERPTMPVSFILHQAILHAVHHRGQISQMLDAMKIDNDFSGMSLSAFEA